MLERLLGDPVERRSGYIAKAVYGANDGVGSTFVVVAGVAGAALDLAIVLILGVANLLADGFSMGTSDYLSQRSAMEYVAAQGGTTGDGRPPVYTTIVTYAAFVIAVRPRSSPTRSGLPQRFGSRSS